MITFLKNNIYERITPRIALFFISIPFKFLAIALVFVGIQNGHILLIAFGLLSWILWFTLIFAVAFNNIDEILIKRLECLKRTVAFILIGFFVLCVIGILLFMAFHVNLIDQIDELFVFNDSAALTHQALENLLNGDNPYKASNVIEAFKKYDVSFDKITPIMIGRFSGVFPYPDNQSLERIWEIACQTPESIPSEIMSMFNYPAGSIIISAPFFLAGISDMRIVGILLCLPVLIYATYKAASKWRVILLTILLLSIDVWSSFINGGTGYFVLPFLLLSWLSWKDNWALSALSMGLAVAMKQTAWFYLIFYMILIFREKGIYKSLCSFVVILLVFSVINIPFIIDSPGVWLSSVLAPLTKPLFPMGVGIVSLVSSGIVGIQSSLLFSIMEGLALVCCVLWYFFNCNRHPYTGPILAVIPLFFAWRSLPTYFIYADIIIIVSIIVKEYSVKCKANCAVAPSCNG
jgi:hypothetical protein